MNLIKTIIVDDEIEAREGLKLLLADDPEIEIMGLCKNGVEAIDMISEHEIDLVFLDIQMPVINGFEVVNSLAKDRVPHIVFVTAYDQFALKAFEIHAIDYILKPFTNTRFAEGLARAKQLIIQQKTQQEQEKLKSIANQLVREKHQNDHIIISDESGSTKSRLIVKEKGHVKFIPLEDIIWLEAYDYYVKIHVKNKFHMIRESMKKLETQLPADQFMRIHKSSIINKAFIKEVHVTTRSDLLVKLSIDKELNVGRSYKEMVKTHLKN